MATGSIKNSTFKYGHPKEDILVMLTAVKDKGFSPAYQIPADIWKNHFHIYLQCDLKCSS